MPRKSRQIMAIAINPDRIKLILCEYVERSMLQTGWSQRTLAERLGTSQANISRVGCKRVKQLTFNQLFRYLLCLEPHARIMISKI